MTSFFDKLSGKLGGQNKVQVDSKTLDTRAPSEAAAQTTSTAEDLESQELNVDIYQDSSRLVIYALAGGVDPQDFDIALDEENDVLVIRGSRKRPLRHKELTQVPKDASEEKKAEASRDADLGKFVQEECSWTPFYRRIILPQEVDILGAEAVFKKGVLVIVLPILKLSQGRKLKVIEESSAIKPHEA